METSIYSFEVWKDGELIAVHRADCIKATGLPPTAKEQAADFGMLYGHTGNVQVKHYLKNPVDVEATKELGE